MCCEVKMLPVEVWVQVFKFLEGPELYSCQQVCSDWNQEITHMMLTRPIGTRGLRCQRLSTHKGAIMEHRRCIWDSISLKADQSVLLTSVGVYTPSGSTAVAVDARPIEDNLRPVDMATELDSCYEEDGNTMSLYGKEGSGKPFSFHLEADQWWEIILNISPQRRGFDSLSGGTIWSATGSGGRDEIVVHGVTFSFRRTVRDGWRSDVETGQIPYFYFWRI